MMMTKEEQIDLDREVAEERNREYYDEGDIFSCDDYFSDYKAEITEEFLLAYDSEFKKFIKDSYEEYKDEVLTKC